MNFRQRLHNLERTISKREDEYRIQTGYFTDEQIADRIRVILLNDLRCTFGDDTAVLEHEENELFAMGDQELFRFSEMISALADGDNVRAENDETVMQEYKETERKIEYPIQLSNLRTERCEALLKKQYGEQEMYTWEQRKWLGTLPRDLIDPTEEEIEEAITASLSSKAQVRRERCYTLCNKATHEKHSSAFERQEK